MVAERRRERGEGRGEEKEGGSGKAKIPLSCGPCTYAHMQATHAWMDACIYVGLHKKRPASTRRAPGTGDQRKREEVLVLKEQEEKHKEVCRTTALATRRLSSETTAAWRSQECMTREKEKRQRERDR
jgi:hypothetical protein